MTATRASGPVVFAYDGSELAKLAIEEAGQLIGDTARQALAVTVWQPFDVGFIPPGGLKFDAQQVAEVRNAAELTAAAGASAATAAGFRAEALAIEGAPAWRAITGLADERDASLIVLGSHGRSGVASVLVGSVASSVVAHSHGSVLVVHRH
ncbi:MAG TPA: universal stress protein [Solirubrobacteraceae bacterium]|jgi:nucleotide-binding universal stress UspA family protein|nr:universal stress protein [Solirubrobacteraceae bacterium]